MPLKYPDYLQHNNPNLPLLNVSDNSVQGLAHVDTITERNNIPADKRCVGAIVVVAGVPYVFEDSDLANWTVGGSWKNMAADAPDGGIQLTDLDGLTAAPSGLGSLSYDNTTGDFTLTPTDISGKADSADLTAAEADIAQNASDINALETTQATQDGLIAANTAALGNKADQSALNDVISDVTDNTNDISALQTSQAAQDTAIAGKASQADLDAAEADIAQNSSDIVGALGAINTNAVAIGNLQTEQGTQNSDIADNASDIAALETSQAAQDTAIAGKVGEVIAGTNITSVTQNGDEYTVNAADAPVQTITSGSANVTVSEPTTGDFEISVAAAAEPVTTQEFTVTDPIGSIELNDVIAVGTELETIIRNMLVSFQVPSINITSPNPGVIEHNVALSFANVTFSRTNAANINAAVQGLLEYNDAEGSTNDESLLYTPNSAGSQTVNGLNVSDVPVVEGVGSAGTSGTPKQRTGAYYIRVTEQDTEGNNVVRQENYTVRFRTYFGASNIIWSGSTQTASLITDMHSNKLSSDSRTTWTTTVANDDPNKWTFLIMPTCHWTDAGGITEINQGVLPAFGAFSVIGSDVYQGCEYTIVKTSGTKAFAPDITIEVL